MSATSTPRALTDRLTGYVAPWIGLALRAARGRWWVETTEHRDGAGPPASAESDEPADDRQSAAEGHGPLVERLYTVVIEESRLDAGELLADFMGNVNDYAPVQYAWFRDEDAREALREGTRWTVELPGPWSGPVDVTEVDDRALRLHTREGHLEAGWIEFSTEPVDGNVRFSIISRARAGDVVFDLVYRTGLGRLVQTDMWVRVLESGVRRSGGRQHGRIEVVTVIHQG